MSHFRSPAAPRNAGLAGRGTLFALSFLLPSAMLLYAAPQKARKQPAAKTAAVTFEKNVRPLIQKFCVACHSGKAAQGGVSLAEYSTRAQVLKKRDIWEKVSTNVSAGHMPPPNMPQPTRSQRELIADWIDSTLSQEDCALEDPGRVTMRRLNRAEYNNTIRDLVGLDLKLSESFPSDDVGYGFDNVGDVLSISPILMEKYLAAAEKVVQSAIATPESAAKPVRFEMEDLSGAQRFSVDTLNGHMFASNGELGLEYHFPVSDEYTIRIQGAAQQAGDEPARMGLRIDGREVTAFDVKQRLREPGLFEFKTRVEAGKRKVAVAFLNDFYQQQGPNTRDRNLFVDWIEVQGKPGMRGAPSDSHARIFLGLETGAGNQRAAARKILAEFARRAYRRPVQKAEVDRLLRYVDLAKQKGDSFERGIQLGVQAILVSPHFLFKVEIDPEPNNPKSQRLLNDYELATRLSYFLWSSMPDETLFQLAAQGKLKNAQVLRAQAKRMLKDPKARALADNFGGQWLTLRNLSAFSPDPKMYPAWSETLRAAMRTETERYFEAIVREDRSILKFISSNFTFVNEPLAKHYGIPGVTGDEFQRVTLAGGRRGGVLTQASILAVTSNPTRTSPVKRGKWVLEQFLGTPPPPPPPGVGELKDEGEALKGTLRQRMEQHRKDPGCASCHSRMDPIGFGLENFDAIGAWRDKDGLEPVDASGTLPDGKSFNGPGELKKILLDKKQSFVRNLNEKLLTYAIGRGVESTDKCNIDEMAKQVAAKGFRFSSLVDAVIMSDPFRKRRGDVPVKRAAQK